MDEIAKWQPGTTIDTRDAAQSITLQIIVQAVFGIDDRNRRDHYVTVVKAMMRDYVAPFMFFPALRRAPLGLGPWQRFSARRVELDAMLSEQISHRRHTGADGYDDVLSVLDVRRRRCRAQRRRGAPTAAHAAGLRSRDIGDHAGVGVVPRARRREGPAEAARRTRRQPHAGAAAEAAVPRPL